ncbi:hypothetical protein [Desulfobacter curvatus]|uniref:hypothetical protein n=1 Tax=Desulfobacter curvatus TaxID=2290 RepID=UPI0003664B84|nr:hypothetical protein [Desulfobacter curvatus]
MALIFKKQRDKTRIDPWGIMCWVIQIQKERVDRLQAFEDRTGRCLPDLSKEKESLSNLCSKLIELERMVVGNSFLLNGPVDLKVQYEDLHPVDIPDKEIIAKRTRQAIKDLNAPELNSLLEMN